MSKRHAFFKCALLASTLFATIAAQAQTQFTSLTAFGDSGFDHGANLYPLLSGQPLTYPSPGGSKGADYTALPYPLQSLLGLPNDKLSNYAIAGATSGTLNSAGAPLGLSFQMNAWAGRSFGARDLVAVHLGVNDAALGAFAGQPMVAVANQTATNSAAAMQQWANAGARHMLVTAFSDGNFTPLFGAAGLATQASQFGNAYYAALQRELAPLAQSGVRIFLFDQFKLTQQVKANMATYGFDTVMAKPGMVSLVSPDGIHPSTEMWALEARYVANILNAPATYAAQGEVAQITATNFARSIFSQLDGARSAGFGMATMADLSVKAPPRAAPNPWSLYLGVTGSTGSRDSYADALGLRYDTVGGQIGAEYRVDANIKLGALFNYSNGQFDLRQGGSKIDQDAYQFGAYASFSYARWFTDVMALYSRGDLKIERAGVIDTVRGDTSADSFAIGGKTAYLFDVTPWLQAGPLAGLTYIRSRIDGYTETGDPVLTFAVGGQKVDSLIGSAGVQFRMPFMMNGYVVNPYVNLTAEHDFRGNGRTLLATLTQSPLLPIYTPVAGRGGETYGALQAGVSAPISDRTSIAVNIATTFARRDGNDFGGSLAVRYRF